MKFFSVALFGIVAVLTQSVNGQGSFPSKWSTVDYLDLPKYTGGWFEVLSSRGVHNDMERGCSCSQTFYNLNATNPDVVDVTNACLRYGTHYEIKGNARRLNATQFPGKFQVRLNIPFNRRRFGNAPDVSQYPSDNSTNYNIIKLYRNEGGDYAQALVGGNDAKYFWLISRTPTVPDQSVYEDALDTAQCYGYDTSDPFYSDQSQCVFSIAQPQH